MSASEVLSPPAPLPLYDSAAPHSRSLEEARALWAYRGLVHVDRTYFPIPGSGSREHLEGPAKTEAGERSEMFELLLVLKKRCSLQFEVESFLKNGNECIFVLRKE